MRLTYFRTLSFLMVAGALASTLARASDESPAPDGARPCPYGCAEFSNGEAWLNIDGRRTQITDTGGKVHAVIASPSGRYAAVGFEAARQVPSAGATAAFEATRNFFVFDLKTMRMVVRKTNPSFALDPCAWLDDGAILYRAVSPARSYVAAAVFGASASGYKDDAEVGDARCAPAELPPFAPEPGPTEMTPEPSPSDSPAPTPEPSPEP